MNERKAEIELDLQKLLQAFLYRWWQILICMVIGILCFWYISINFITPMYKASVTVYVNNVKNDYQLESISSTNLTTSQKLVQTYINIIKSDTVMEAVCEASQLEITPNQIRSMMSAEQVEETELFKVTITDSSPERAMQIANSIAVAAPGKIEEFVEGSSTKIIDYAKVPTMPSTPNIRNNSLIGGLLGAAVAMIYIVLRLMLDVRIKEEDDLTNLFNMPVLAQIPAFVEEGENRRGYSRYKKYGRYQKYGYGYGSGSGTESKEAK